MTAKKILVIGSGPGGYPAALKAKELGAEVTLAESADIGGTCLNRGCIPSKSFLDSAHKLHALDALSSIVNEDGIPLINSLKKTVSWQKIRDKRKTVVERLRASLEKLIAGKGIEIIRGVASFESPHTVNIQTSGGVIRKTFDAAIIAAGTKIFLPPPFDSTKDKLLDSDNVWELTRIPSSIAIIGGGAIGVEFSCFFNALGCKVHLIEMMPTLLPGEDEAVCRVLQSSFEKRGIALHPGQKVSGLNAYSTIPSPSIPARRREQACLFPTLGRGKDESGGEQKILKLDNGTAISVDEVMVCVGRFADLSGLGLDKAGISWDRKGIKVDYALRTQVPHIFAVGDVNGMALLAHAASAQGEVAAVNANGGNAAYDNSLIPRCVYSWPEIASVGLNRTQAADGKQVKACKAFFSASGRAMTQDETEGFVQIVCDASTKEILGAQIIGYSATEMIHVFAAAMKAKMKSDGLKKVVFAHPTMSESIKEALSR